MKRLLLVAALFVAVATTALAVTNSSVDGKEKAKTECCKKGEKKECCQKAEGEKASCSDKKACCTKDKASCEKKAKTEKK